MDLYKIVLKGAKEIQHFFINAESKEDAIRTVVEFFLQDIDIEDTIFIEISDIEKLSV